MNRTSTELSERVLARDRTAIAEALNLTEDRRPAARRATALLLSALRSRGALERSHRIGVTGPPGVGKSTLLAAMTRALRAEKITAGVLAIDPSSRHSGGAFLGDRVRIAPDPADQGIFVRSLATAGELGGLARSVPLGLLVLSAAFDVTLVETVGVGQTETDVRDVVDTVVLVVQPGSGDALQFLKAGVMEVPDLVVVNKADEADLARRAEKELRAAMGALGAAGIACGATPIVLTSARDGTGIDALVASVRAHRATIEATGELAARRRAGMIAWAARAFARRHGEVGVERAGGENAVLERISRALEAGREPLDVIDEPP
jgi:LAO/AO transport system kinase